jgi:tRNA dimethylallyltransferase
MKKLIVITGPTASGKSALAIQIAKRLHTEIISADSRQIYKGIPIVTAVPTPEELAEVTHHLIEILPLEAYYSASMFESDALKLLDNIFERNDYAVVCGGSMLYVDALCNGLDNLPTVPTQLRNELMDEWHTKGDEWLRSKLQQLDNAYFHKVDPMNMKRIFHAIEISITAGKPYSELCTGSKVQRPFEIEKIAISMPRSELFERINRRVDAMISAGLENEARNVFHLRQLNSLNTVGLKEMFAYFDGIMDKTTAIERIKKNTRVYAKKQMTWFQRDKSIHWIETSNTQLDTLF